jgi:hypothetical protein
MRLRARFGLKSAAGGTAAAPVESPAFHSLWIHTMNRCRTLALLGPLLLIAPALHAQTATATTAQTATQTVTLTTPQPGVRQAPQDVRPAMMAVSTTPPEITLNGKPDRLSPGARIRGLNNMLVLSGTLAGQTVPVVYRRDGAGLVHEAWILTAEEYAKVGGSNTGDPEGYKRFYELLALIFAARR